MLNCITARIINHKNLSALPQHGQAESMAYLTKEQYEYRREAAAYRNAKNEKIAVENGMTEQQADLISRLCSLRHELHCCMDAIVTGGDVARDIRERFSLLEDEMEKIGLPELGVSGILEDLDDMDGLIYYYGEDVPEDHDSEEFKDWYDEEYQRICSELSNIHKRIEHYLKEIDEKYKTSFCPTGALRIF